jgi:ankyrin repeat protein
MQTCNPRELVVCTLPRSLAQGMQFVRLPNGLSGVVPGLIGHDAGYCKQCPLNCSHRTCFWSLFQLETHLLRAKLNLAKLVPRHSAELTTLDVLTYYKFLLMEAVRSDQLTVLQTVLKLYPRLTQVQHELILQAVAVQASYLSRLAILEWMLFTELVDIKDCNPHTGETLMHGAAFRSADPEMHLRLVQWLVSIDGELFQVDAMGQSPLYHATQSGNLILAQWMIVQKTYDPDMLNTNNDDGQSPLHACLQRGRCLATALWLYGLPQLGRHEPDHAGKSIIHSVMVNDKLTQVDHRVLVDTIAQDKDVDLNAQDVLGNSVLCYVAAQQHSEKLWKYLTDQLGVVLYQEGNYYPHPMETAAVANQVHVIRWFIHTVYDGDVHKIAATLISGIMVMAARHDSLSVLQYLSSVGMHPNLDVHEYRGGDAGESGTLFSIAAVSGSKEVLKWLLGECPNGAGAVFTFIEPGWISQECLDLLDAYGATVCPMSEYQHRRRSRPQCKERGRSGYRTDSQRAAQDYSQSLAGWMTTSEIRTAAQCLSRR